MTPADEKLDAWIARNHGVVEYAVGMAVHDTVVYFAADGAITNEADAWRGPKPQAAVLMCSPAMRDVFRWTRLVPIVQPFNVFTSFPTYLGR